MYVESWTKEKTKTKTKTETKTKTKIKTSRKDICVWSCKIIFFCNL